VRLLAVEHVTEGVSWIDATFHSGATEAASRTMPPDRLWRRDQQQTWKEVNRVTDARSFAFTNSELVVSTRRAIRSWEDLHSSWEARWIAHPGAIRSWTFSPDGRWLATVTQNGVLQVVDGGTLESQRLPGAPDDSVVEARFSPDGRWFVIDAATTVRVLKSGTWQLVPELFPAGSDSQHPNSRFTSDSRWLVTISRSRMHLLHTGAWEIAGIITLDPPDPTFNVNIDNVRVSPDGRWIAARESFTAKRLSRVGSNNPNREARLRIWSLNPGRRHGSEPSAVDAGENEALQRASAKWTGFETGASPERRTENSRWKGTNDGALVRLWPRLPADFIESGCQRVLRNLSLSEWKEQVGDEPYRRTCANVPGPIGTTAEGRGPALIGKGAQ
jgi:WD40-like Beta Propeller Repeat